MPACPRPWIGRWSWLLIALAVVPAFWHVLDFPNDVDGEYPTVERPTFSRRPPPAYRLAEPGDTIDRIGLYFGAAAVVVAGWGVLARTARRQPLDLWPAALALTAAGAWHAATPGPTFDGWHGLGWRVILDRTAPSGTRLAVGGAALILAVVVLASASRRRAQWSGWIESARRRQALGLIVAAALLILARQGDIPSVEPAGYWPRWAFDWGLLAFMLGLVRLAPPLPRGWRRAGPVVAGMGAWVALVAGGINVVWSHRPLERMRTVEPGRIYMSAMPTYRGLEIAHGRHHFKTIINLFPEDTPLRSPRLPDELRFAREHGIRYVGSPGNEPESEAFLDETLRMAQDPDAWPILVHCHGCMDRTPAWMGIYRFVVQGRPLIEILREIEQHRGYRPKASVTLLYNRVLPTRAPDRYAADPTARLLQQCARGVVDRPNNHQGKGAAANPGGPVRVTRSNAAVRRP